MVVCKLMGGLGNQLFQYAYGLSLAKYYKDEMCLDTSYYTNQDLSIYRFAIRNTKSADECNLNDIYKARRIQKAYHVYQKVKRTLNHERIGEVIYLFLSKKGHYYNFDMFYYPMVTTERQNKYTYGYFQGETYFESVKEEIKQEFVLKERLSDTAERYKEQIKKEQGIAIHIRLGDYTNSKNSFLNVCTDKYYNNAIEYVRAKAGNRKLFVFTNDAEQVKKKLYIAPEDIIVSGTKDYEDLFLISQCSHQIMSNSTFSWWGAYLSDKEDNIVVAPEKWLKTAKDEPCIYRKDMIKIPV